MNIRTTDYNQRFKLISLPFYALVLYFSLSSYCHAHAEGHSRDGIVIKHLSSLKLGSFNQSAAEIVAYAPKIQTAFVTNSEKSSLEIISLTKPSQPSLIKSVDLSDFGSPTSVAVGHNLVAVSLIAAKPQENGTLVILDNNGTVLNTFKTGSGPDMVTFTPNGGTILVANEGEPNSDYTVDPEGSISILKLTDDIKKLDQSSIKIADFKEFNKKSLADSVRVFGKNATPAEDFEPEYITVSKDSKTAWVSLQENNAIAVINIENAQTVNIIGLGFKSFESAKNGIDASDKDDEINIKSWPVKGMYQPDTIANFEFDGQNYIVTANEGDSRDYDGYSEVTRVAKASLDKSLKKAHPDLTKKSNLGRLKITTANGDNNGDGKLDELYAFGARSFSIWHESGKQVYDSGSQLGRIIAQRYPRLFNDGDTRSDNKGVEPESLVIGKIDHQVYAFIGLERSSGIMAYNVTNPNDVYFSDYFTNVSPALDNDDPNKGDLGPEGLSFISSENSPIDQPLLLAANEISGTLSVYLIEQRKH